MTKKVFVSGVAKGGAMGGLGLPNFNHHLANSRYSEIATTDKCHSP